MKSITIDNTVTERLKAHFGGETPAISDIVVFEATVLSTKALRKDGTIWEGAKNTRATLSEMAAFLNSGNQVPLHTNHLQGYEMPVGRFFYAEVFDLSDGNAELRALFYLPKTEEKLISDIETGVIQALSVGISHKAILCSECGWDYLSDESDYVNLIERTCLNGHEIGKDGVHAVGAGLKIWRETSLVSLGASPDAAIHSRSKTRLTPAQQFRLAASGSSREITLVATTVETEEPRMEIEKLVASIEAKTTELVTAQLKLQGVEAQLAAATEKTAALEAKIEELNAALADAKATAPDTSELDALKASLESEKQNGSTSLAFLQDQAVKALVASGSKEPEAPETIAECIAAIETSGKNLVNLFAGAGNSVASDAGQDVKPNLSSLSAFMVKA